MDKLKVNFFLKKDKTNNEGQKAIYGKIRLGSSVCTFSTGKYISRERWIKTNYLRNTLKIESEESLKNYIYSLPLAFERSLTWLINNSNINNQITATDVRNNCHDSKQRSEKKISLLTLVNNHNDYFKLKVSKKERAKGSLEKYLRMAAVLKEFLNKKYKVNDIDFEKVNSNFIYKLDNFLRFERAHGIHKGLDHNTTVKYIRNISSIISYSLKRSIIKENPFTCYNETLKEVDTVYLTKDELNSIE